MQPAFGKTTTARIGYYNIQSIVTIDDEILLVALWKLRFNEDFLPVNQVLIDSDAFEFNPVVNASVDVTNLIGCTLNVRASYIDLQNFVSHTCNWSIIEDLGETVEDEKVNATGLKADKQLVEDAQAVELQIANAMLDMDEAVQAWDDYQANLFYDLHN
ncbi:hypothetical protein [Pedobacter agri]|uniref:hypothetical protein n=1 Tax=Pedobacter agri TaxID=454586 RepID=UPI0029303FEB|nr:hypothetical protein [Pedobacter agri]